MTEKVFQNYFVKDLGQCFSKNCRQILSEVMRQAETLCAGQCRYRLPLSCLGINEGQKVLILFCTASKLAFLPF